MGESTLENRSLIKTVSVWIPLCFFVFAACTTPNSDPNTEKNVVGTANPVDSVKNDYLIYWRWVEDDFNTEEKDKLKKWIQEVYDVTMTTLGKYPFNVYVYFHRSDSQYSPVPFGFTSRKNKRNEVHFYVNPSASLEELLADWTAPHELSHLAVPFLGQSSKWFSEGFATFLSRQTMIEMGYFTIESFDSLYFEKIDKNRDAYASSTSSFIEVSDSLAAHGNYGAMYWGGTTFFMILDLRLRAERNQRFIHLMQQYQECCRGTDKNLKMVIRSWDNILGNTWARELLNRCRDEPAYRVMELFDIERNRLSGNKSGELPL